MKGYKVFNPDWTCRGFQYKVGETYEIDRKPVCCECGFHFCENICDCFSYYDFNPENKVAEIEAVGAIDAENNKSCTNKIVIAREIEWNEVLALANSGKNNSGFGNSGFGNSGNYNSGNHNSGDHNSGNHNSGDHNSDDFNSGDWNSGYHNSGNCNSGGWNSGACNSGYHNSCDCNSGDWNSGACNSGNHNSGDYNIGDYNSGDFNSINHSSGCFNTTKRNIDMFNKPSDWTFDDWRSSESYEIMITMPANVDARQGWWNDLGNKQKREVMSLPNFNADIFKEVTDIDARL